MKTQKNTIFYAALFALISTIIAEITFGNPNFPITCWVFQKIPAWQWYVAVHGTGFVWVVFLNNIMFQKNILLPTILSTLFFSAGETLNWFFFQFFIYTDEPFGKIGAFIAIQGMYFVYCIVQCFLLRLSNNVS